MNRFTENRIEEGFHQRHQSETWITNPMERKRLQKSFIDYVSNASQSLVDPSWQLFWICSLPPCMFPKLFLFPRKVFRLGSIDRVQYLNRAWVLLARKPRATAFKLFKSLSNFISSAGCLLIVLTTFQKFAYAVSLDNPCVLIASMYLPPLRPVC